MGCDELWFFPPPEGAETTVKNEQLKVDDVYVLANVMGL